MLQGELGVGGGGGNAVREEITEKQIACKEERTENK